MSRRIIHATACTAIASSLSLALGCAKQPAPQACGGSFDEAEVVRVLDEQRMAWNRGDLDAFLSGYEPSQRLLFTSGGNIRRGFDETRERYRTRYGESREGMGQLSFEMLDVRALGSCADAAIVLGRWALTDTPVVGSGVFSVVLERHGDRWEIVHDHTSTAGS
jgi:ketosteroid isomerase-like protein